ncbi:MAG: hypothetical protein COV66_02010 [Nitrospinae bacterium CG11_big_fil_rev_8_21_14_0_20_45_15]|nr:MAG: hypothetical protein COV66_02010 [Nitrospinae bacterium CG11_big_fil_rev_8_21_14_0_20_45_15]
MCHHSLVNFFSALFKKPFYIAFFNIFRNFKDPVQILKRYVLGQGEYPADLTVKTPIGRHTARVYDFADIITLVECFGKLDYRAPKTITCAVDFGSNIGLSALYFLTRGDGVKTYLYEPLPQNIVRLKENLQDFNGRWELKESAVGLSDGTASFQFEPTGRYGRLQDSGEGQCLEVSVQSAVSILEKILSRHDRIDILKIDVEGLENGILSSLNEKILARIDRIYAETDSGPALPGFRQEQYGAIARYFNLKVGAK